MSDDDLIRGLIVRAQSSFFEVVTQSGRYTAQLRGRLKEEQLDSDLAAVGDQVLMRPSESGPAMIEEVLARARVLSRQAPGQDREQVIIANPDQAVLVFSCRDPKPNRRMLDRMLVAAERDDVPALICVNKVDLDADGTCRAYFHPYQQIGYPVLVASAKTGVGIPGLRSHLQDRITVFAGPSGVGKSSLLNAIESGLALRTGGIREGTRKGKHTTVSPKLVELGFGGYVADTPGVKAFALWDIEAEELDAYFPEISGRVADCRFSDCSHHHEPGCAVREAVDRGSIDRGRYESYLRIRLGEGD